MAKFQNWQIGRKLQSLTPNRNQLLRYASILVAFLLSGFLISKSISVNFEQYQQYRNGIVDLQEVDFTFNQEILKSRYELFASYDKLVGSLAEQKYVLQQLQNIPDFVGFQERQEIESILKEIRALIKKRETISERFKSRNALLKNSLRYLPLLTSQLDQKFDAQEKAKKWKNNQITSLRNTLNALIRNLLIYNVAVDKKLILNIENLRDKISQLAIQYELTEDEFPSQLVKSHADIILTTKPQVEELTVQLLQPLDQETVLLYKTIETSYKQAARIVNQYRCLTCIWFVILLILGNYLFLKNWNQINPVFSRYKKQVDKITKMLAQIWEIKKDSSASKDLSELIYLAAREDELGQLATKVQQIAEEINNEQVNKQQIQIASAAEESFASLTARLTLTTENRKKMISSITLDSLETIVKDALNDWGCQLIALEGSFEKIDILFSYTTEIKLSQLIFHLRVLSSSYFHEKIQDIIGSIDGQSDIWSSSYSITSCEGRETVKLSK